MCICWCVTEINYKMQGATLKTQSVSFIKTIQLMLYREIIAVCSEIHTKHINTAVWTERGISEC